MNKKLIVNQSRAGQWLTLLLALLLTPVGIQAEDYGITIAGVQVTDANASGVTGDNITGTITYTASTNTLTLSGATVTGVTSTNGCIVTSRSELKIAIIGENTLDCSPDSCTTIRSTLQGGGTLTFVKGGDHCSLTLKGGHAIRDFASVTVSSGLYWDDAYTYEVGTTNYGSGMSLRNPVGQETYSSEATNAFLSDAQPLGLTVGGVEVTSWNASNVMNDDLSEEGSYATVVFDPTTNTLTLHNASLDMTDNPTRCPIESSIQNLTVKLIGYNQMTIADGSDLPYAFRYTGEEQTASLTLLQEADEWGSFGSLNASGVGELGYFCPGYTLTNEIREVGSEITGWEYSIDAGNVPSLTISYTEYYDIWIENARLTSSNRNGGHSGDINYNDENHTLHLGGIHYSFVVKSKMPALTIELANNNDISGVVFEPTDEVTSGTLTFSKCADSEASENTVSISNDNGAIVGFSSVTVESPLKIAVPATAPEVWDANTKQAIISDATYYDLKVNGEWVTSANANNVTGGTNDFDRPQVTYNPDTNTLTLDNASLTVYNSNAIDFGVANLKVNFVGESNITVYDYDEVGYAAFNSTLANNTITFTTSATEPGSLYMMLQNPVANATASYENGLCSWANGDSKYIKQLYVPYLSVEIDDSQYVLNIASSDNPDGTKHYYSIDYADASIADVPDTEAQAETGVNLLGACTVTAYAKYGDYQSMNAVGKLFGFERSTVNVPVGSSVDIPAVVPAIAEADGLTISYSPDTSENDPMAYASNGKINAGNQMGTTSIQGMLNVGTAEPAYKVLNEANDNVLGEITVNVVPVAPTVDPEENGTYSTNIKVTMFSDYVYNDPETAAIKYYLNDAQSEQLTYQDEPLSFEGDVTIHAWVEVQDPTNATVHKSEEVVRTYTFKPEPTLAFSLYDYDFDDNYEFSNIYGDQFDEPELKVTGGEFQVTYSSSNTNVATVDSSTGEVTIKSAGKTTITATVEETDEHFGATRSYQVRVIPKIEMTENCVLFPGQTISIQVSPEGATVKYGINEEAKTDYTGVITVNENMLSQHDIHVYVNATYGEGDDQVESDTNTRYLVYDRPTVSVPAGTYNDTQHVQISNLPQRDGGYPKVYYYFNDAENDATLYENDAIIDIVESTMLKYYIFEEETLQYKSIPIAAEYTVIPKTELNISYAENSREWASYYADEKSLETPAGLQAYVVTNVQETGVTTTAIPYIPQGEGILLKRTENVTEPIMAKALMEDGAEVASNLLQGTAESKAISTISGTVYVLYNDGFTRAYKGSIPAHRSYLVLADQPAEARLWIWEDDEQTTAVGRVRGDSVATEGALYNLNGQRVSQPSKGLYISNGKKRIVK